jgi:hypothetical protein
MQEETKELLDYLNEFIKSDKVEEIYLNQKRVKQLLDYITNLQEYETIIEMEFKREYAKRYLEERRKEEPHLLYPDSDEIYKRYYELKEENKKLKELCDKYEEEYSTAFELWKNSLLEKKNLQKENEQLNNIIDGMEKFFKYEFDNEVRPLNSYKISVWTICLDKLNELKGDNK